MTSSFSDKIAKVKTALEAVFVKKSATTGLLKNDGGVMTSGSGAGNYSAGNHTHDYSNTYASKSHSHTTSQISDFPTLSTVATTGSYNDLTNKPTIPDSSSFATASQLNEVSGKVDSKQSELIAGSNITLTNTSELPTGYTQLDYIIGNKSQYLDTGWKFTGTYPTTFECKFMPYEATGVSGYGTPYGLQTTNYTNWIYVFYMGNGFYLHLGGSSGIDSIPVAFNTIYDTSFTITSANAWSRTINGQTTTGTYTGSIDTTSNMYIMGGSHGNQPINQMNGRIYSFKITVGNNVVRNYIPARRNSDGAIGMYDLANNSFSASTGGGDFIAGNNLIKTTISSTVGSHNQALSTISDASTVEVLVTYTNNTSEPLTLVKKV